MAFTIYRSTDSSAPTLNGITGSLLDVFNACLVTGYGSRPGAGWTKPFPDTSSYGCYKIPTGSALSLFVADNGPGAGVGKEARMTGWDSLTSILAGAATGSNQFPTSAQLAIGPGAVVVRKSVNATAAAVSWLIAADSRSMYGFVQSDTAGIWQGFSFGDFYSIKTGSLDSFNCMIVGKAVENTATATGDRLDSLSAINSAVTGHFAAHTFSGGGTSITVGKHGDGVKGSTSALLGSVTYPNTSDNGLYVSPVWVVENGTSVIRGRMRGFYQILHAITSFSDGQTFTGLGSYAGKSFLLLKQSGNSGIYLIETSDTLETN